MIKILSSYKIIKNHAISYDNGKVSLIDTKIDYEKSSMPSMPSVLDEEEPAVEETVSHDVEVALREKIQRELLDEIEGQKQFILQNAYEEAEKIKGEASQRGFDEGYQAGFSRGYEDGMEKAHSEGQAIRNSAINLLKQAEEEVKKYGHDNKNAIIGLAADMAEAIVHTTIDASSQNILLLIKPILEQYGKKESIIIRCHPHNIDHLRMNLYQLENMCPNGRFIILEDSNLEENGVVIEDEGQIVDLQIKKQIQSMIHDITNME